MPSGSTTRSGTSGSDRRFRPDRLGKLKKLSYPDRFLFFDSESWVQNVEKDIAATDWASGDMMPHLTKAHAPRLVCYEYHERRPDGTYERVHLPEGDYVMAETPRQSRAAIGGFWDVLDSLASHNTSRAEARESGRARDRSALMVVGHNVGYDLRAMRAHFELPARGWKMDKVYDKGSTYIWTGSKDRHRIIFVSSTNFYPTMTLKKLGESFGVHKLDFHDFNTEDTKRLIEYCLRDVEVVRVAMLWLVDFLERGAPDGGPLGPFRNTISSVAFSMWRYRFMPEDIVLKTSPEEIELARSAFLGGHTEPYWVGTFNAHVRCADVNTLYGWVMRTKDLPVAMDRFYKDGEMGVGRLKMLVEEGEAVIAKVVINLPDERHRVAPFRSEKLLFPWGTFATTLCTPELQLVLKYGDILEVHEAVTYRVSPLFGEYMKFVVRARVDAEVKGDLVRRDMAKRLGNHVYGKLGQRAENWKRLGDCPPNVEPHREIIYKTAENEAGETQILQKLTLAFYPSGVYQFDGVKTEAAYSFVAAAAFITSWARRRLMDLKDLAESDGERHVLYSDTDSLHVDEKGYDNLITAQVMDEHDLGMLKIEWTGRREVIRGNKAYSVERDHPPHPPNDPKWRRCAPDADLSKPHVGIHEKFRGIPETAPRVMTPRGPRRVVVQWPKDDGLIVDGDLGQFRNRVILKTEEVRYTKARVNVVGGWVTGWKFPEDREEAGLPPPVVEVRESR